MLKKLEIKGTRDTPQINFNPENGVFEISGNSLPEDTSKFFDPIFDWVENYISSPNDSTHIVCKLEYFNSSSAKMFYQLFIELESLKEDGKEIKIDWHYDPEDSLIEEKGLEYQSILAIPFDMVKTS